MADKAETPKTPEEPKKKAKKLVIIDANESQGDTPPVADEDELAAIAEAFADLPEAAPEDPVKPSSTKISVFDAEETPEEPKTVEESTEVPEDALDSEGTVSESEELVTEEEATEADVAEAEEAPTAPPVPEARPLSQLTNNVPRQPQPVQDIIAEIEPEKEFADDKISSAVDDIVATESDELLAKEDAAAEAVKQAIKKPKRSLKTAIVAWWRNPAARWGTIVGFILLLAMIVALPATRYGILNAAGVRVSSTFTVLSNESQQPLKNASVKLAGQTASTDEDGKVMFTKLKMGTTDLEITKRGFASVQQTKTLGWGSNPFGSIGMTVTGTRFIFSTKDFLSGKVLASSEAVSGEFNAQADSKGKIILAVDQNTDIDLTVTIKANGYRDEIVTIKLTDKGDHAVAMAPDRPRVFVSKRSGKQDIYKIDADGKNESVLLAGTGKERTDLAVLQQPNGDYTAVVSTRLGVQNKSGYLMSNLFMINNKTGEMTTLTQSERIQLVDWSADRIVYIAVTEGASAANPNRSKLLSFQIGQPGAKQIASANYFNDAIIFKGSIYYAPSSYAVPVSSVKFYKVAADGSGLATLMSSEVWNIFRSDYDTLQLSVQQDWYEQKSSGSPTKLTAAPANPKSRTYRDSPDGKQSLWVDNRDGKGVLIDYEIGTKQEKTLVSLAGLQQPVYWLNSSTIAYRITDGRETADYVRSLDGGDAKKLKDVTATDSSNYFN